MKILIAEDDRTSRTLIEAVLSKWDYDVVVACDGDEAFEALQKSDAPRLAILDWEMPGMNGVELCRCLREQEREKMLYLIILTSRNRAEDLVTGLEAGADDFISKPYNNAELKARIDVGRRMISMEAEVRQREKLQGVLEMSGAVCHELNQPLQAVSGFSELLLMKIDKNDRNYETLETIKKEIDRIGVLTRKIMKITRYQSKPYLKNRIVDIDQASGQSNGE